MINNILKWRETILISFAKIMAYRLDFILTVLSPAFVTFFIKYQLWTSIYANHPTGEINGHNLGQMIRYHVWALIVSLIAKGHSSINITLEIRHGKISSYLIYPFNFWEFHTASFLAFEAVQVVIALVTLGILSTSTIISFPPLNLLCLGLAYCIIVSFLWFSLQFLIGILGLWLEETWILRVMMDLIVSFLSGAIIPLEFFPPQLTAFLDYTPFPLMAHYPIKIFMGESIPWQRGVFLLSIWLIILAIANTIVWRKGIRNYTAAGM